MCDFSAVRHRSVIPQMEGRSEQQTIEGGEGILRPSSEIAANGLRPAQLSEQLSVLVPVSYFQFSSQ